MNATSVSLPEPLESFSVLAYICAFTRSEVEPLNAEVRYMIFDTKPLDDIEESDLQALLAKPVPERKRIGKSFWAVLEPMSANCFGYSWLIAHPP